jgi:hypothetical protein
LRCVFDLQVAARLVNLDAVFLAENGGDPLRQHAIPGVMVRRVQVLILQANYSRKRTFPGCSSDAGAASQLEGAVKIGRTL